jgi:hypothetical protein
MKKSKADYKYAILNTQGRNVISIIDEHKGNRSVTSSIGQVIKEIGEAEKINPEQYMIVYRDSENMWDGFDVKKPTFVSLQCESEESAIRKYIEKQIGINGQQKI